MAGSCIAKEWPSIAELQAIHGSATAPGIYQMHCGVNGGDGAVTRRDVQERLNTAVAASPAKDAFNKVPAFPPINVAVGGTGSTIRGIRYAFDNSATSPRSFIFYPLNGKQCQAGDASVNPNDTSMPAVGGSVWTDSFTTGGDYTSNDTVYCVRTLRY